MTMMSFSRLMVPKSILLESQVCQSKIASCKEKSMMLMAMVLKTMSIRPEKNLIDSTFQTDSSHSRMFIIPTTEISQVTLENPSMKENQNTMTHMRDNNSS